MIPYAFVWEKVKTMNFSETIAICDIKVDRCNQLNEYMNLYEYQSHSLTLVQNNSDSIFANFFTSIAAKPIEAKFYEEPPWDRRTKVVQIVQVT